VSDWRICLGWGALRKSPGEIRLAGIKAICTLVRLVDSGFLQVGWLGSRMDTQQQIAGVAQLAEQLICNQQVAGSSPIAGSCWFSGGFFEFHQREISAREISGRETWKANLECKRGAGVGWN
jgi:hypothetical protein